MSTSHHTIEDRLAAYRRPLDEALEQNPVPSAATAHRDSRNDVGVIEIQDFEQQQPTKISYWPKYTMAAASIVLLVTAGLLVEACASYSRVV